MEFLSRKILPIAVDIRTSKNITYTPAPDIIHEAAGHAPIIANNDYADYLWDGRRDEFMKKTENIKIPEPKNKI